MIITEQGLGEVPNHNLKGLSVDCPAFLSIAKETEQEH